MQDTTFLEAPTQFVIQPTPRSLAYAYGFLVIFGGLALFYGIGVLSLLNSVPNAFAWWEKALLAGLPVAFALTLAWWVGDSRRPFRLDRTQGLLFDGDRSVLSLDSVRCVAVRQEQGETADFFAVELVQDSGKTFTLRQDWWPLDTDLATVRERARRVAAFLGVELREGAAAPQ